MAHSSAPALETKFAAADLSGVDGEGIFSGYASLFGTADLSGDLVMPGAFRRSITSRGAAGIRMLYQHDPAEPSPLRPTRRWALVMVRRRCLH